MLLIVLAKATLRVHTKDKVFYLNIIKKIEIKYKEQDVCVNPVFIFHCTYPGYMPDMLMS
jgi:hypothetical protein